MRYGTALPGLIEKKLLPTFAAAARSIVARRSASLGVGSPRRRLTVVAEHSVEDLSHREQRLVDRAFRHHDGSAQAVGAVAHQHEHALTAQPGEISAREVRNLFGEPQHGVVRPRAPPPPSWPSGEALRGKMFVRTTPVSPWRETLGRSLAPPHTGLVVELPPNPA